MFKSKFDLIVITGPSGVGKTTLGNLLINKLPSLQIVDFDSGGVPDNPSVEWRIKRTDYWLSNLLVNNSDVTNPKILCGLCFPSEIKVSNYFKKDFKIYYILLVLKFELLKNRLLEDRNWSDYFIQGQNLWQERLLSEIKDETYHTIIDIENKSIDEVLSNVLATLSKIKFME